MKYTKIFPICLLVLCTQVALPAQMENDPNATVILEKISAQVQAAQNVHYQFELSIDPPEDDAYSMIGEHFQAQDMFYLDLPKFQFVTNGESQWVIDKEGQEIQIHDYVAPEQDQLTDPKILLTIHENPHFKHRLVDANLIEFLPVDRDFEYFRATMEVTTSGIESIQVWAKDGYVYRLSISDRQYDVKLAPGQFVIDPSNYPDHHVEDLRID